MFNYSKRNLLVHKYIMVVHLVIGLAMMSTICTCTHDDQKLASLEPVMELGEEHATEQQQQINTQQCLKFIRDSLVERNQWPWLLNGKSNTNGKFHHSWTSYKFASHNCLVELFLSNQDFSGRTEQIDFLVLLEKLEDWIKENWNKLEGDLEAAKERVQSLAGASLSIGQQMEANKLIRELNNRIGDLDTVLQQAKIDVSAVEVEIDEAMERCLSSSFESLDGANDLSKEHHEEQLKAIAGFVTSCKHKLEDVMAMTRELCKELRAQLPMVGQSLGQPQS